MEIRKAKPSDTEVVYWLGLRTPEIQVNKKEKFMSKKEVACAIAQKKSIFLIAYEQKKITGFIYANTDDLEKSGKKIACIVYIAVDKKYRKEGIGGLLYKECIKQLKKSKVHYVYALANPTSGVVRFFKKRGFVQGKTEVWMDRKL